VANPLAITLHALVAETGAGAGAAVDLLESTTGIQRQGARLDLVTTAADGLDVKVETSPNGTTGWRQADSFEAPAGESLLKLNLHGLDRFVRVTWAGTGTFSVAGEAHQLFVTEADIYAEIRREAFGETPQTDIADALIKGSGEIEDALNSAYTMPIKAIGESVRQRGGAIAAWRALCSRGVAPEGADEIPMRNADEARKWLYRVSQGKLRPPGIVDSTPTEYEGGAVVVSSPLRGW
jgi:hypothetical protein